MSSKPTVVNAAPVIKTTITRAILEGFTEKFLDHLQVDAVFAGTGPLPLAAALFERNLVIGGGTRGGVKHIAFVTAFSC